jgi:hypothetical protein
MVDYPGIDQGVLFKRDHCSKRMDVVAFYDKKQHCDYLTVKN